MPTSRARTRRATVVAFTHPEKVLYPKARFTKGDLIRYYLEVAPWLLPHLEARPVTLRRFPNGIHGEAFYEKDAPGFMPNWIRTFPVPRREGGEPIHYILVNNARTLAWCANFATIEFHPFLHRVPRVERPTLVALDLDSGAGADLLRCIEVASLLVGYYEGGRLMYAGKVRQGLNPRRRADLGRVLRPIAIEACPFANLPNSKTSHFGEGVTREQMKELRWVQPRLVAQVSFTEWTRSGNLRHATFKGLRYDKDPREVVRERPRS